MSPPDFIVWDLMKGRVVRNKHRTFDYLKSNITNETAAIPPAVLAATFANTERRVRLGLQAVGINFAIFCNAIISTSN
jgi:hypothetical protein